MGPVRGVLIEDSVLFSEDENVIHCIPSASAALLRRLKHSKLRVGICHQHDISPEKATFLAEIAALHSFGCISLHESDILDSLNQLLLTWNCVGETCCYVTSRKDDVLSFAFNNLGWKIICISAETGEGTMFIGKLEELLINICYLSKMVVDDRSLLTIGYIMKPSREDDFAERGAFPMYPTENGLMFVPFTFELPLASQIQKVDAIVQKATDEIINIDLSSPLDFPKSILFSKGMHELERYTCNQPDFCMIDPLNNIYPLLDRHKIQEILLELDVLNVRHHNKVRAPLFIKVDNFHNPNLREQLSEAKLLFPVIVKPQVACGVSDAHNMALVFKVEDFGGLGVPLPAIVQEYVDHGSSLFKFYVLGGRIFHAVKKSLPNASYLLSMAEKSGPGAVLFNSLKSLPVSKEDGKSTCGIKSDKVPLDVELVHDSARWLRKRLGLTIFGFDVVIQEGTGDHVIVDLNYLPSFKEVPDSDALPAFWEAIKSTYQLMKEKK